jgi:hypothetical protein
VSRQTLFVEFIATIYYLKRYLLIVYLLISNEEIKVLNTLYTKSTRTINGDPVGQLVVSRQHLFGESE